LKNEKQNVKWFILLKNMENKKEVHHMKEKKMDELLNSENWWLGSKNKIVLQFYICSHFIKVCILLSEKTLFFGTRPHYNLVKDLKIRVFDMIVIWKENERQFWFVKTRWKLRENTHVENRRRNSLIKLSFHCYSCLSWKMIAFLATFGVGSIIGF